MSNLLPLPNAITQAQEAAVRYMAALKDINLTLAANGNPGTRRVALQQAYSNLSTAQWELEEVLK